MVWVVHLAVTYEVDGGGWHSGLLACIGHTFACGVRPREIIMEKLCRCYQCTACRDGTPCLLYTSGQRAGSELDFGLGRIVFDMRELGGEGLLVLALVLLLSGALGLGRVPQNVFAVLAPLRRGKRE